MKQGIISVTHFALIGLACVSYVGISLAANEYRAALPGNLSSVPEQTNPSDGSPLPPGIWADKSNHAGRMSESKRGRCHLYWILSLGTCIIALILCRRLPSEAAVVSLVLCVSLALLSVILWSFLK